jgi:hypothetical protein
MRDQFRDFCYDVVHVHLSFNVFIIMFCFEDMKTFREMVFLWS